MNCLHETFFDAALADAAALDKFLVENKRPVGPLHGVPISLKDQFHVRDVETTMGYVGWIGTFEGKKDHKNFKTFESEMVRELRALGAILYCKTSVPHTLMTGETVNNIIDYTWNPKNRNLCSGGSSGGEGALIGLKGSPAGFGTDIGGSIRIPAGFNGLYGIRPSVGRMPYEGMANSMDGQNSVLSVVGPLATTPGALRLIMQSILSLQPWLHDPFCVPMPWRPEIEAMTLQAAATPGALAFGILAHDGLVTPHPPVRRAISTVTKLLEATGHHTLPWQPPSHKVGLDHLFKTWTYDGGLDCRSAFALSGEPAAPQVASLYGADAANQSQVTASDVAATNVALRSWRKAYLDYWNGTAALTATGKPVDAFVCPLAPYAAARREMYNYYGYSAFVNGLDLTSCVVPVLLCDKNVDKVDEGYGEKEGVDEVDKKAWESYDPEIYDGAWVSVQVIGRRLEEEKVLALAEWIGGLVKAAGGKVGIVEKGV